MSGAKWTHEPVGFGALNRLRNQVCDILGPDEDTEPILFARGFEVRLAKATERERVRMIHPDALYA